MTHTTGPWNVATDDKGLFLTITNEQSVPVAGRICDHANARLIAAAPELLDALYAALPYVEEGEEFNHPEKRNLSKTIRALISKVEGQQ